MSIDDESLFDSDHWKHDSVLVDQSQEGDYSNGGPHS